MVGKGQVVAELPEVVDIAQVLSGLEPRVNVNLFWVDGEYTFRVANIEGAFPWHYHPESDEAWFVLKGRVRFRTELGDVEAGAGQSTIIRSPLKHSPLCLEPGTQVLIVNSKTFTTVYTDESETDATARFREYELDTLASDREQS